MLNLIEHLKEAVFCYYLRLLGVLSNLIVLSCVPVCQPVLQTGNGALTCRPPKCWEDISCQFYCRKKMQISTSFFLYVNGLLFFSDLL